MMAAGTATELLRPVGKPIYDVLYYCKVDVAESETVEWNGTGWNVLQSRENCVRVNLKAALELIVSTIATPPLVPSPLPHVIYILVPWLLLL